VAEGTRTPDHRDHNPGLYQLSYRHRERRQDSSPAVANWSVRPRSSADRAADFESACGGSTPPGAIEWQARWRTCLALPLRVSRPESGGRPRSARTLAGRSGGTMRRLPGGRSGRAGAGRARPRPRHDHVLGRPRCRRQREKLAELRGSGRRRGPARRQRKVADPIRKLRNGHLHCYLIVAWA
jgi:hypothetical protein